MIIWKDDAGRLQICCPTGTSAESIAKKDVPTGKPYKIIDDSEIPIDRSMRDAWTVDDAELTDGIGEGV